MDDFKACLICKNKCFQVEEVILVRDDDFIIMDAGMVDIVERQLSDELLQELRQLKKALKPKPIRAL